MTTIRMIAPTLHTGGTETHLRRIIPNLIENGFSIRLLIINTQHANDITMQLQQAGATITFLETPIKWLGFIPPILVGMLRLWLDMIKNKHEITHFFLPKAYLVGMICALLSGNRGPLIMSRRSLNIYQSKHPWAKIIEHKLHKKTDRITGNSQAILNQLEHEEGVDKNRLHLIYNGFDYTPKIQENSLKRTYNIPEQAFVMIIIANFIPYKGHLDLLEALDHIKEKLPQPWHLCCIGYNKNKHLEKIKETSNKNKLNNNISWITNQSNVHELLPMADIALLCSHQEGFANAILEAMACSKAVIATDAGGNSEAVIDKKTGLIVPIQSPIQLGEAILKLSHSPELCKEMGENGHKRWQQHFQLSHCIESYQNMYNSLKVEKSCVA